MFNLCKRIASSDCASRILSGCFNSARSNSSVYNPPCIWGSRTMMIHTTNILEEEGRLRGGIGVGGTQDEKLDIVHIKLIKNNTFVTITDSKSLGCLEEMKGGPKASSYAAEATAEHVGGLARNLGLKLVVMRVNGFTHFKKKKQAILAFGEKGSLMGVGIGILLHTTRCPHNGCRLPKKRRV